MTLKKKIEKLTNLIAKNGNYGSLILNWSDGRGDWLGEIDLGINPQKYKTRGDNFEELIDSLIKNGRKKNRTLRLNL